jgi:hypothetical protein
MPLLDDILGFVGEKFRNQNQQVQNAMDQFRKTGHLPPDLISSVAGINPIGGVISPQNWKTMAPEAKALTNLVADKAPSFFEKIMSDPRELMTSIGKVSDVADRPGFKSLASYSGEGGINLNPSVLGMGQEKSMPVLAHEMQHYLNEPDMLNMLARGKVSPETQESVANKIWKVLPENGRASLDMRLGQINQMKAGSVPSELTDMVNDLGHEDTLKLLRTTALDEGLAHLTEHTMRGTPGVNKMAGDLGVGIGNVAPAYRQPQQQSGLLGSIMGMFGGGQ